MLNNKYLTRVFKIIGPAHLDLRERKKERERKREKEREGEKERESYLAS